MRFLNFIRIFLCHESFSYCEKKYFSHLSLNELLELCRLPFSVSAQTSYPYDLIFFSSLMSFGSFLKATESNLHKKTFGMRWKCGSIAILTQNFSFSHFFFSLSLISHVDFGFTAKLFILCRQRTKFVWINIRTHTFIHTLKYVAKYLWNIAIFKHNIALQWSHSITCVRVYKSCCVGCVYFFCFSIFCTENRRIGMKIECFSFDCQYKFHLLLAWVSLASSGIFIKLNK